MALLIQKSNEINVSITIGRIDSLWINAFLCRFLLAQKGAASL